MKRSDYMTNYSKPLSPWSLKADQWWKLKPKQVCATGYQDYNEWGIVLLNTEMLNKFSDINGDMAPAWRVVRLYQHVKTGEIRKIMLPVNDVSFTTAIVKSYTYDGTDDGWRDLEDMDE